MPVTLSIASQKGGEGKTTLTSMVAGRLHYVLGRRCLCVDADHQKSLLDLRRRDEETLGGKPEFQDMCNLFYSRNGCGCYPIFQLDEKHYGSLDHLLSSILSNHLDVVLVDLPGTVKDPLVLETLLQIEYLFVPVTPDYVSFESALAYHRLLTSMRREFADRCRLKEIRYFLNKVETRSMERVAGMLEKYRPVFAEQNMVFFKSMLPRSTRFGKEAGDTREIYRNTYLPMSPASYRDTRIDSLTDEIIKVCQLNPEKD